MAKQKKQYVCENCGATYLKWQGFCNTCQEWNSISEEIVVDDKEKTSSIIAPINTAKPIMIKEIEASADIRRDLGDAEFNRVLGGGLVSGAFVLLGGEPGIGKSTLHYRQFCVKKICVPYMCLGKKVLVN